MAVGMTRISALVAALLIALTGCVSSSELSETEMQSARQMLLLAEAWSDEVTDDRLFMCMMFEDHGAMMFEGTQQYVEEEGGGELDRDVYNKFFTRVCEALK